MFKVITLKFHKSLVLGFTAAVLAFGVTAITASYSAMAASKGVQVQFGLKVVSKTFQNRERADR